MQISIYLPGKIVRMCPGWWKPSGCTHSIMIAGSYKYKDCCMQCSVVRMVAMLAHTAAAAAAAVFILLPAVFPLPLPAGDTPFLAIKIDRDQGGVKYSYDSAVSKQLQNLVVSGKHFQQ